MICLILFYNVQKIGDRTWLTKRTVLYETVELLTKPPAQRNRLIFLASESITCLSSSRGPLLRSKVAKTNSIDQAISNVVFISIRRPPQRHLGSRPTKLTIQVEWSPADDRHEVEARQMVDCSLAFELMKNLSVLFATQGKRKRDDQNGVPHRDSDIDKCQLLS